MFALRRSEEAVGRFRRLSAALAVGLRTPSHTYVYIYPSQTRGFTNRPRNAYGIAGAFVAESGERRAMRGKKENERE